ncbi:MAG: glycosyltransferase [Planctomycetota bacterium]|nr:glycosyltransferase [Planctomycetota bacterium]
MRSARLGVIVPLANEEEQIARFLEGVLAQFGPGDRVWCVLDNVSRDDTRSLVEQASARDARVQLVWAPENRCVVDAYFRGYREALAGGMDWILEMDAGFSHDPLQIPRFIAAMEAGADFAAGSRFMPGGRYVGPWSRYLFSRGGTLLAWLLLDSKMHDMTSGFECFTRATLEQVVARGVWSRAHFFQTEIRHYLHRVRWVEVPITYSSPSSVVGSASLGDAFRNLWRLRQLHKSERRQARAAARN